MVNPFYESFKLVCFNFNQNFYQS